MLRMTTIVYGPPCSGKTTYVKEHAGGNDLIVDADAIYAALSNRDPHDLNLAQYSVATELRETLYDIVKEKKGRWENAWIISIASTDAELREIMDRTNADNAILIETPMDVCLERSKERPICFDHFIERWFDARKG